MRKYVSNLCSTRSVIVVGSNSLDVLNEIEGEVSVIHSTRIDPEPVVKRLRRVSSIIAIDDGEKAKDISVVLDIVRKIHMGSSPDLEWIVALGGGTIMDVAGFAASIYKRGIKLINIPTTLLAMVDAAMGGKNGVNMDGVKNMLGTFYQPALVISDVMFLESLSRDDLANGMAEVIKYCITLDRELCELLEARYRDIYNKDLEAFEEIIFRSAVNKMRIVEADERDNKGIRIVLNYGHTIGHAIEASSGFKISHGKAVSIGMVCEASLAEELGVAGKDVVIYLEKLLSLHSLPRSSRELGVKIDLDTAAKALKMDKKRRRGKILMPLPKKIGEWERVELDIEILEGLLKKCLE